MNTTLVFIVSITLLCIIFDVYIILKEGRQESISAHIIRMAHKYPLIVLLTGILMGHLFWNMPTESVEYNVECAKVE